MSLSVNCREKMLQVFNDDGLHPLSDTSIRGHLVQRRLLWFGHTSRRPEAEQITSFFLITPPRSKLTKGLPKTWAITFIEDLDSEPVVTPDGERIG